MQQNLGRRKIPVGLGRDLNRGGGNLHQLETDCDSKGCGLSGRREWTGSSRGQSCGKLSRTGSSYLSSRSTVSSPDCGL